MMRIYISTPDFDLNGHIGIDALPGSTLGEHARRFNRVKTLDGSVVVNDGGFAHGDRTWSILLRATLATDGQLKYIVENHAQVRVTTREGTFIAVPSYEDGQPYSTLQLYVTDKLSV